MINVRQQVEKVSDFNSLLKKIIKGVLFSYIITIFAILVFSIIITYSNISEAFGDTMVKCATYISIFSGGLISALNTNKKGWMTGALTGLIYMLLLLIIGIIKNGFILNFYSLTKVLVAVFSGAIGGIAGINIKSR